MVEKEVLVDAEGNENDGIEADEIPKTSSGALGSSTHDLKPRKGGRKGMQYCQESRSRFTSSGYNKLN